MAVEWVGIFFDALPFLRKMWRWIWERNMEIEVHGPHSHPSGQFPVKFQDDKPIFQVNVGERPHIYMWADLVLINHSTSHKERIIGCTLHLKKRHWLFWDKTIADASVETQLQRGSSIQRTPITDIELSPVSAPTVVTVEAEGPIGEAVASLPKKMKLVLEFRMVGPIRRIRRIAQNIRHDPKKLALQKETEKGDKG